MKKEYDFSKAQRGKFYRTGAELNIPVYLDHDVAEAVRAQAHKDHSSIGVFVNEALRKGMRPARSKPRRGAAKRGRPTG